MPIPHDTIAKLEQTFRAISALGAELTEEEWKRPSELPGWTVQDNLSHLIGTERSLQGLDPAPEVPTLGEHVRNPIGRFNELEVELRRRRTGSEVLAEWDELAELRLRTLHDADDAYFEAPTDTPTGPGTVADFLHIRVLDCWAHEQDMRRAVGRPGSSDGASAAHTLDRLVRTLPIVVGKRAGTPEGAAMRFEITGPIERDLTYEVHDGRATLVDRPTSPPAATIRMDSETFIVLALGRRRGAELIDRITIEGDEALARRAVDQLTMMI